MNTKVLKNKIGKIFDVVDSTDTINVESVDFKNKLYECIQTYDGQYGGKVFFFVDYSFAEFETVIKK